MIRTVERPWPGRGLSAKILALTVVSLLIGEILIFVPSIARFRLSYLDEMVAAAHLATLASQARGGAALEPALEAQLLQHVGARTVTLWQPLAQVMLGDAISVDRIYDLRDRTPWALVLDAFETLIAGDGRMIRVVAKVPQAADMLVDVAFDETAMRRAMIGYAGRILALSIILSAIVASLLFMTLRGMIVQPLADVTSRVADFRSQPEDASIDVEPSARTDEIGIIERELVQMQREIRRALKQQMRLAALGAAVGRVSHDLKNILSSAVLISDRLETSADPQVRAVAPRLVERLERAIRLTTDTLRFAGERLPEPRFQTFALRPLLAEVASVVTAEAPLLVWTDQVDPSLALRADRDQLYRVFLNLARNAREARSDGPVGIKTEAEASDTHLRLVFSDDGPGIPAAIQQRLFNTFWSSAKPDGSGLGLAICREIMRTHGGDIELIETGAHGTRFRLTLPILPARAA